MRLRGGLIRVGGWWRLEGLVTGAARPAHHGLTIGLAAGRLTLVFGAD